MDMDDVYEWTVWVLLSIIFFMVALAVIMLLLGGINEVAYQIRLRRSRQRRATTPPPTVPPPLSSPSSSFVEKLLDIIPDVAYQEFPGGGGDSDQVESCVICVTPYEAGETCSVLPACKHLFHKACVAKWLRVRCTCPLCRAKVAASPLPHTSLQSGNLNDAENMV